jgi:hypothetical protein
MERREGSGIGSPGLGEKVTEGANVHSLFIFFRRNFIVVKRVTT